jgi:hypothetical protein
MSIHCTNRVWTHSTQRGAALFLLIAIAGYADDDGFAFPGQRTLAAKTRMSVRHTRRLLAALQASGELLVLDRPGRGSLYVVLPGADPQALAAALDRAGAFGACLPPGALQEALDRLPDRLPDGRPHPPAAGPAAPGAPATTPDNLSPTPDNLSSPTPDNLSSPPDNLSSPTPDN